MASHCHFRLQFPISKSEHLFRVLTGHSDVHFAEVSVCVLGPVFYWFVSIGLDRQSLNNSYLWADSLTVGHAGLCSPLDSR